MTLTAEEVAELKNQLRQQVSHLPEDQRKSALGQIDGMSSEAIESMLKQQKSSGKKHVKDKTIFRSIVDGDIPSISVEVNSAAISVMDIAPISKGHVLVIPRKPVNDAKHLPVAAFSLAKNIAKRISSVLKAKSTLIQTENKFNECVIHVIPSYADSSLDLSSPRSKSVQEELEKVASEIRPRPKKRRLPVVRKESPKAESGSSTLSMRRRVP